MGAWSVGCLPSVAALSRRGRGEEGRPREAAPQQVWGWGWGHVCELSREKLSFFTEPLRQQIPTR